MLNQITVSDVQNYLGIDELSDEDNKLVAQIMSSATHYIKSYTGLSEEEINAHSDMDIAFLALVQDMFDHRTIYADKTSMNATVESILNMHCVNLL